MKRATKNKEKCEEDFLAFSNWEQIRHEGQLIQANLFRLKKGMKEAVITDWESGADVVIPLDPTKEPRLEYEARFRRSKKFRLGLGHIDRRREMADRELSKLQALQQQLDTAVVHDDSLSEQIVPPEPLSKEERLVKKRLPYHEFLTSTGLSLWVGKSSKDNDALTFKFAKGSDWWLHVRDYPGSHVVLRVKKGEKPDSTSLEEAKLAALNYSKAKGKGEAAICITQCKYVTPMGKGNPGKVQISKHKVEFIHSSSTKR